MKTIRFTLAILLLKAGFALLSREEWEEVEEIIRDNRAL